METVLIGMERGSFVRKLRQELKKECRVLVAEDWQLLTELMDGENPDVLVLDLHLPGLDPVGFLRERHFECRILGLCRFVSGYLAEALGSMGISYLLVQPCQPETVALRIRELLRPVAPPESRLRSLLQRFSIPVDYLGGRCLLRAIPLAEMERGLCLTGGLYPAVGKVMGMDWHLVERDIRYAVAKGWKEGNRALWLRHFPHGKPTSGEFIARMAELDSGLAPEPEDFRIDTGACG